MSPYALQDIKKLVQLVAVLFFLPSHAANLSYLEQSIREDDVSPYWDFFITPNEVDHQNLSLTLAGKKDVLIVVGIFRALHDIEMGNFTHAIFMDAHPMVAAFNRINFELIKKSRTRTEWLAVLFSGQYTPETRDYKKDPSAFSFVFHDDHTDITAAWDRLLPDFPLKGESLKILQEYDLKETLESRLEELRKSIFEGGTNFPVNVQKYFYRNRPSFKRSIFNSDKVYNSIRKKLFAMQILSIQGSISGDAAMVDLANILNISRLKVSFLDISNILNSLDADEVKKLQFNMSKFSWSEDATLLVTGLEATPVEFPYSHFSYFLIPKSHFNNFFSDFLIAREKRSINTFHHDFYPNFQISCNDALKTKSVISRNVTPPLLQKK